MTATLPPLPEPDTHCWDEDTRRDVWSHSPDQLRAYGAACAAAELEACARVCEELHYPWRMGDESGPKDCAAAIRARKDTE